MSYTRRSANARGRGGCITGLLIILLLVGAVVFALGRARNGVGVSVGEHPKLVMLNCRSSILIQQGQPGQIVFFSVLPLYAQDPVRDIIELNSCDGITVLVPPHTDLQVRSSDAITVLGVRGSMDLNTNGSRISLIQSTLEGKSTIDNNGGLTTFSGSLAPESSSTFDCNSGALDIALPSSAAFHLVVSGNLGALASDFPGASPALLSTNQGKTDIGQPSSGTTLNLDLNSTSVSLHTDG